MVSKINDLEKKNPNFPEKLENLHLVYSSAFNEAVRQISVHCSERGQFIKNLWDSYNNLIENTIIGKFDIYK